MQPTLRHFERLLVNYRRQWRSDVFASFVTPLLYVVAMGVVLGGFISADPTSLEGANSYLAFVVPGLVAAHALQIAAGENTYTVLGQISWDKTYVSAIATPLQPKHLVGGHLLYCLFRLSIICGVYTAVMIPFGVYATWWSPIASWLAACLTGLAFSCLIYGIAARVKTTEAFGVVFRFGVVPMFLFAGAFFPIANLGALSVTKWVIPLWHGVSLTRMGALDTWDWPVAVINLAVLLGACAFGAWWSAVGLQRRLIA